MRLLLLRDIGLGFGGFRVLIEGFLLFGEGEDWRERSLVLELEEDLGVRGVTGAVEDVGEVL